MLWILDVIGRVQTVWSALPLWVRLLIGSGIGTVTGFVGSYVRELPPESAALLVVAGLIAGLTFVPALDGFLDWIKRRQGFPNVDVLIMCCPEIIRNEPQDRVVFYLLSPVTFTNHSHRPVSIGVSLVWGNPPNRLAFHAGNRPLDLYETLIEHHIVDAQSVLETPIRLAPDGDAKTGYLWFRIDIEAAKPLGSC